jgi:hypothetical protein
MMRRESAIVIILCLTAVLWVSQVVIAGTTTMDSLVPKTAGDGWSLREAPETFTKETLFEHIDGQADLFLQYGFEKSVFAIYQNAGSADQKIDVDIYDMGNSLQAFGVFSRFRQDHNPAGIGLDSCIGDQYVFFYKGRYFVAIQSTDSNPSALKRLGQEIESGISDNSPPPREIGYFPADRIKPGSVEYFPSGLLGHQFLKRGFKASYIAGDERKTDEAAASESRDFSLFLSIFDNSREALDALKLFRENLLNKGRLDKNGSSQFGPDALVGTDPYSGNIIVVQKGAYLIGAVGFEQDREANGLLAEMVKQVK